MNDKAISNIEYDSINKSASLVDDNDDWKSFIKEKRELYETFKGELSTKNLAKQVGIDYEMFRKILNQTKPTKKRDCIIAICVALKCGPGEVDEALYRYLHQPGLYTETDPRERFISDTISVHCKEQDLTVSELNQHLEKRGFKKLDILDKRKQNKKKQIKPLPYIVGNIMIKNPIGADFYEVEDNSLSTQYNPDRYLCRGIIQLTNKASKVETILMANSNGEMTSYHSEIDDADKWKNYSSIEETGDFQFFFPDLLSAINKERKRLLSILNDSRNYPEHKRVSAKVKDRTIYIFSESFNTCIPELNEYYVMTYINGEYQLLVYRKSAFMFYYLTNKQYSDAFDESSPRESELYNSLKELDDNIQATQAKPNIHHLLQIRKKFFLKAKNDIDDLLIKLRSRKCFIQDPRYFIDCPEGVFKYYNLEESFHCKYDNDFDELEYHDNSANFTLANNTTVTITYQDLVRAYELGIESVDDICHIKLEFGSIDSVLQ
ncbi:MAG: helix-turn-helix domain-containing protein [Clostridiales bacterium]|nr:helix-turn-helix domain-containing protein [Clostridiales bacterium]